jgi:predicted nucleotidyltransferase
LKRSEATKRLLALIDRAAAGGELTEMVDEVYVFGSYARGAPAVSDIDVCVEYTMTEAERARPTRERLALLDYLEVIDVLEREEGLHPELEGSRLCSGEVNTSSRNHEIARAIVYFGREIPRAIDILPDGVDFTLCVINPWVRQSTLQALRFAPARKGEEADDIFRAIEWGGEEKRKLIARLEAAHRIGELPETLHAVVEGIRAERLVER